MLLPLQHWLRVAVVEVEVVLLVEETALVEIVRVVQALPTARISDDVRRPNNLPARCLEGSDCAHRQTKDRTNLKKKAQMLLTRMKAMEQKKVSLLRREVV
jgi:hypothetical protein